MPHNINGWKSKRKNVYVLNENLCNHSKFHDSRMELETIGTMSKRLSVYESQEEKQLHSKWRSKSLHSLLEQIHLFYVKITSTYNQ